MNKLLQQYQLTLPSIESVISCSLQSLPLGTTISDGLRSFVIGQPNTTLDISRWDHKNLKLTMPSEAPKREHLDLLTVVKDGNQLNREVHRILLSPVLSDAKPQPALWVKGLPAGAVLNDSKNQLESAGSAEKYNLLAWDLADITLRPPLGWHEQLVLHLEPEGLDDQEIAALGSLQICLVSSNAFIKDEKETVSHHQIPLTAVVMEGVTLDNQVQASIVVTATKPGDSFLEKSTTEPLDDAALADLEKMFRNDPLY
jgi:hypothetical protein